MDTSTSQRLFEEAVKYIPGGVNSPVRAMKSVGMPHPLFIARAAGSHLWDADGNEFVDFVNSWGPMILGWGHPRCPGAPAPDARRRHQLRRSDGARGRAGEADLRRPALRRDGAHGQLGYRGDDERRARGARLHRAREGRQVHRLLPRPQRRLPRRRRQRRADALAARQPRRDQGDDRRHPPRSTTTTSRAWSGSSRRTATRSPRSSSSPSPATWAWCRRRRASSRRPRELCTKYGAVLIFDEVITGFRVAWGGAQERFGVVPDLTTLGKIIGGGLPVGAFGGRRELMETVAPLGSTYQAGTLSGNPLAMAAGAATLERAERAGDVRAPRGARRQRRRGAARRGRAGRAPGHAQPVSAP